MNQPDKAHFLERVSREMDEDLGVLNLSPRDALAACCRILAREGHESGLAGQVTALGEQPDTWWTLRFGLGFEVRRRVGGAGLPGSVGEYGWAGNAGTLFWIDPKEDLIAIYMVQVSDGDRIMLRNQFRTMVQAAIID